MVANMTFIVGERTPSDKANLHEVIHLTTEQTESYTRIYTRGRSVASKHADPKGQRAVRNNSS